MEFQKTIFYFEAPVKPFLQNISNLGQDTWQITPTSCHTLSTKYIQSKSRHRVNNWPSQATALFVFSINMLLLLLLSVFPASIILIGYYCVIYDSQSVTIITWLGSFSIIICHMKQLSFNKSG